MSTMEKFLQRKFKLKSQDAKGIVAEARGNLGGLDKACVWSEALAKECFQIILHQPDQYGLVIDKQSGQVAAKPQQQRAEFRLLRPKSRCSSLSSTSSASSMPSLSSQPPTPASSPSPDSMPSEMEKQQNQANELKKQLLSPRDQRFYASLPSPSSSASSASGSLGDFSDHTSSLSLTRAMMIDVEKKRSSGFPKSNDNSSTSQRSFSRRRPLRKSQSTSNHIVGPTTNTSLINPMSVYMASLIRSASFTGPSASNTMMNIKCPGESAKPRTNAHAKEISATNISKKTENNKGESFCDRKPSPQPSSRPTTTTSSHHHSSNDDDADDFMRDVNIILGQASSDSASGAARSLKIKPPRKSLSSQSVRIITDNAAGVSRSSFVSHLTASSSSFMSSLTNSNSTGWSLSSLNNISNSSIRLSDNESPTKITTSNNANATAATSAMLHSNNNNNNTNKKKKKKSSNNDGSIASLDQTSCSSTTTSTTTSASRFEVGVRRNSTSAPKIPQRSRSPF